MKQYVTPCESCLGRKVCCPVFFEINFTLTCFERVTFVSGAPDGELLVPASLVAPVLNAATKLPSSSLARLEGVSLEEGVWGGEGSGAGGLFSSMFGRCLGSAVGRTANPSASRRPPWSGLLHKYSRVACSKARCVRRRMTNGVPPATAAVIANDSSSGGLSADNAPMHSLQADRHELLRKERVSQSGWCRQNFGRKPHPCSFFLRSHRGGDGLERGERRDRVEADDRRVVESHGSKWLDIGRRGNGGFVGLLS